MSGMAVIDVAIGLMFMYLLVSLLVTIVQEWVASRLRMRATNLYDAIHNMLADPKLAQTEYKALVVDVYDHPLIKSLYKRAVGPVFSGDVQQFRTQWKNHLPSYLPSRAFAIALIDVLRGKTKAAEVSGAVKLLANAQDIVAKLPDGDLKTTLGLMVGDFDRATDKLEQHAELAVQGIERWFNDAMGRASGWYKRKAQVLSFVIAVLAAAGANADTISVASRLWQDSSLRAAVSARAAAYYNAHTPASQDAEDAAQPTQAPETIRQIVDPLKASSLPVGWSVNELPADALGWLARVLGWLLTAAAASLGAAFWFDVLGKALQIRGTGPQISAITGTMVDKGRRAT